MSEPIFFNNQDEWKQARLGLFTSSEIHRLLAPAKRPMTEEELAAHKSANPKSRVTTIEDVSLLSEGAITYILEKIAEKEAEPKPEFYNADIEWGKEQEPQAVLAFCERYGYSIHDADFLYAGVTDPVFYQLSSIAGGTPDIIMSDAIGEIKCPNSITHLRYLLMRGEVDKLREEHPDYYAQIQMNMMLCKRDKCYFISYDPRFKKSELQLCVIEVPADAERQQYILTKIKVAAEKKEEIEAILNTN